jgi:hypothetical protein
VVLTEQTRQGGDWFHCSAVQSAQGQKIGGPHILSKIGLMEADVPLTLSKFSGKFT